MEYLIYKHTCIITGKSYIGQTCDLNRRTREHLCKSSTGCTAFKRAINKYGWAMFTTTILEEHLTLIQANDREQFYIKTFETLSPGGYNLTSGGNNGTQSEEANQKRSNTLRGRPKTEEHKQKLRTPKPPRTSSMREQARLKQLGKHHTEQTKQKVSIARSGKRKSEETKQRMSKPKYHVTCPHCNKEGGAPSMKRWHFNNCPSLT